MSLLFMLWKKVAILFRLSNKEPHLIFGDLELSVARKQIEIIQS